MQIIHITSELSTDFCMAFKWTWDNWSQSDIAKVSGDSVRTEEFIVFLIHVDTFLIMDQLWKKKSNTLKLKHFLLSQSNVGSWVAWFNSEREVSLWFKFNVLNRSALWTLFFLLSTIWNTPAPLIIKNNQRRRGNRSDFIAGSCPDCDHEGGSWSKSFGNHWPRGLTLIKRRGLSGWMIHYSWRDGGVGWFTQWLSRLQEPPTKVGHPQAVLVN